MRKFRQWVHVLEKWEKIKKRNKKKNLIYDKKGKGKGKNGFVIRLLRD